MNFATAVRFKGRKGKLFNKGGKGKGFRNNFRRLMSKGRAGKKGKGQGKGYRQSYGSKGKGAYASTSWEEDDDPTAFYDPYDPNPLNHFYWDVEWCMPVYDPEATTETAAAAMKSRKGKGGKKGGKRDKKGKSGNSTQSQETCIKWSQNRCNHGKKCRFSHSGPGGFEGSKGAAPPNAKGVAAPHSEWTPAGQQASGQVSDQQWTPAGYQQQWVPAGPSSVQEGSATLALMPYQPNAAAQHQHSSVHPEDRAHVERYMVALHRQRQGAHVASATLQTSSPPGLSSRGFPQ
jgi:hypothetical protein